MELDRERAAADVARWIAVLIELRALLTKEGLRISEDVFLARSFHADDEKVSREVEGMLHALGYRVVSGESSEAKEVSEKVKERIESCDVTVALMTPFHGPNGLEARPSSWVVSELAWGRAQGRTAAPSTTARLGRLAEFSLACVSVD